MWRERAFRAMNTGVAVWLLAADARRAERALDGVERFFLQAEYRLSRFRADSEVSRLNRERRIRPSRMLRAILRQADALGEETGGLFDPLQGGTLIAAGYDRTFDDIGSCASLGVPPGRTDAALGRGRIAFHPDGTLSLPDDRLLDLGGIAKGWAADRAADFLAEFGPACVDAGGDIRVTGPWAEGQGFQVEVEDPFHPDRSIGALSLAGGAIATSGIAKRWWRQSGEFRHHLIDPRTGLPADNNLLSVTVRGATALEAEVAAKTAFILGEAEGWAWLDARGLTGLFVHRDGTSSANLWDA